MLSGRFMAASVALFFPLPNIKPSIFPGILTAALAADPKNFAIPLAAPPINPKIPDFFEVFLLESSSFFLYISAALSNTVALFLSRNAIDEASFLI